MAKMSNMQTKKTFAFGAGFPRFDHLPCGVESSLGPDEHGGKNCGAYEMQRIVSHDLLSHQQHQGSVRHDCDSQAFGYFLFHDVYSKKLYTRKADLGKKKSQ